MLPRVRIAVLALTAAFLCTSATRAADLTDSLKEGTPDIKMAGPLAFGPEGILFIGDPMSAAIFAVDTGDRTPAEKGMFSIKDIDGKIASLLGIEPQQLLINDLAVNPASGRAYLSLSRGKGPDAMPVVLRTDSKGKLEELSMKNVKFAKAMLTNANQKNRKEAITHLEFLKDRVVVSGLSNEDFASNLRSIPFPFKETDKGTSVEIFHGAHGRFETASPVRTFTAYEIDGKTNLLAAYMCTPLVRFPLDELKPGEKVRGTTVAELGNRNRPLDIFVYQKDGKDYALIANSDRGVMKVKLEGVSGQEGITKRINGTAGLTYETIKDLKGVMQMDRQDKENALLLVKTDTGAMNLQSIALP